MYQRYGMPESNEPAVIKKVRKKKVVIQTPETGIVKQASTFIFKPRTTETSIKIPETANLHQISNEKIIDRSLETANKKKQSVFTFKPREKKDT
jgi:hypothetical protein